MQLIRKFLIAAVMGILLLPIQSASAYTFDGHNGRIAFTKPSGGIFAVRKNGNGTQHLSARTATEMTWSPDGTQLAFAEREQDGATRLKIMNIATGIVQSLTRQAGISDSEPVWSPSGMKIAFVRAKRESAISQRAIFTVR